MMAARSVAVAVAWMRVMGTVWHLAGPGMTIATRLVEVEGRPAPAAGWRATVAALKWQGMAGFLIVRLILIRGRHFRDEIPERVGAVHEADVRHDCNYGRWYWRYRMIVMMGD